MRHLGGGCLCFKELILDVLTRTRTFIIVRSTQKGRVLLGYAYAVPAYVLIYARSNEKIGGAAAGAGGRKPLRRAAAVAPQGAHIKAEASQFASAGAPQASQQPAGSRAKPATAKPKAQGVPKQRSPAQRARNSRRLNQKHLASKMWAYVRVASRMLAWCMRARTRCGHPTLREQRCTHVHHPRRHRQEYGLSRAEKGCGAQVSALAWYPQGPAYPGRQAASPAVALRTGGSRANASPGVGCMPSQP